MNVYELDLTLQRLRDDQIVEDNKKIATQLEMKAQTYISNIVKPVADILVATFPACAAAVAQFRNDAIIRVALVSGDNIEVDRAKNAPNFEKALAALSLDLEGEFRKPGTGLEGKLRDVLAQLGSGPRLPPQQPLRRSKIHTI